MELTEGVGSCETARVYAALLRPAPFAATDCDSTGGDTDDGGDAHSRLLLMRATVDESFEEFVCPITRALPLEPAAAEDGRVYERQAIERWLRCHARSPVTNLPMGDKLLPAVQVKNAIERAVRGGALPQDKAGEWATRLHEQDEVEATLRSAEGGDVKAMVALGGWYDKGHRGLQLDRARAREWWTRAADVGDDTAMFHLAKWLMQPPTVASAPPSRLDQMEAQVRAAHGLNSLRFPSLTAGPTAGQAQGLAGPPRLSETNGGPMALFWLTSAARLGNVRAQALLSDFFSHGLLGLPVDAEKGYAWMQQAVNEGSRSSLAFYSLGSMLAQGRGVAADGERAAACMRTAAELGSPTEWADKAAQWLRLGEQGLPLRAMQAVRWETRVGGAMSREI